MEIICANRQNTNITIVDNFFDESIDDVLSLAQNSDYNSQEPIRRYPGDRTKCLSIVNPEFYAHFCSLLLNSIFDITILQSLQVNILVYFQRIDAYSPDSDDIINTGWIHQDHPDKCNLSGIVYLNKHHGGTTLFTPISTDIDMTTWDDKYRFYSNDSTLNLNDYRNSLQQNHSQFTEDIVVSNKPNRMFCFPGNYWHQAQSFHDTHSRYTVVFFIHDMHIKATPAIEKHVFVTENWISILPPSTP